MMVLGTDGSTATLQILPEPTPGRTPAWVNPAGAAAPWIARALHPPRPASRSRRAPKARRRTRDNRVAAGQVRAGWGVLTAGRWGGLMRNLAPRGLRPDLGRRLKNTSAFRV